MRASNRGLCVASLLMVGVVGTACGGSSSTPTPPAVTHAISGTITGATSVTVTLSGASSTSTTTAAAGTYAFTGLANGSYTVTPSKPGYAFAPLATAVTVNGADQANKDFTATAAAATYTVSGAVTGATQDGVTITISLASAPIGTVNTAGGGVFSFSGVANGAYVLTAAKAGYTFAPLTIDVTVAGANRPGQDFVATAIPYTISGHIAGAALVSVSHGTSSTITDASGNYTFTTTAGTYVVTPSKLGYTFAPVSRSVIVTSADVTNQDFTATATAGYIISGTVTGPWIRGVKVTLGGAQAGTTTTDAAGAYAFTGLPDGSFTVTPSLDGYGYSPAAPSVVMGGANKVQNFTATPVVPSYAISGTVSYTGVKTGRVYVWVNSVGCPNCSAQAMIGMAGPGTYTIRGLQDGSYTVSARRDSMGQGMVNASDPWGSAAVPVLISGANAPSVNIALIDPVTPSPGSLAPPSVLAGDHGTLMFWNTDMDLNSREKATSYDLSWGTDAGATNGAGSPVRIIPRKDGVYFQSGLTNGTTYYYMVRSNVGATSGAYSTIASAVVGPVAGGFTVSGTVTFPVGATGPLYLAIGDGETGNMKVAAYPLSLTSPVAFSVTGVPAGAWGVYAILDQNGNGVIDEGDLSNTNGRNSQLVTVGGDTSGVSVTLSSAKSLVSTTTEHAQNDGGMVHSYSLQTTVTANLQRVVRATLVAGKNVGVPADLGGDREISTWWNLGTTAPAVGDVYTYEVAYGDGSSELLTAPVTTLLSSFAQGLTATTSGGGSVARPLFSWSAPASPPVYYGYTLSVWGNANWYWPQRAYMSPSSVTQVLYNVDGSASNPDLTTGSYTWSVTVKDAAGNGARQEKSYIVP